MGYLALNGADFDVLADQRLWEGLLKPAPI